MDGPCPAASPHHISPSRVILALALLAAVIAAVGLAGYLPRKEREEAGNAAAASEKNTLPAVTTARVRKAAADTDVVLPGDLSALMESSIYSRAAGYVRKRYVDIGDRVRAGQLMARSTPLSSISRSPGAAPLSRRPSSSWVRPKPRWSRPNPSVISRRLPPSATTTWSPKAPWRARTPIPSNRTTRPPMRSSTPSRPACRPPPIT